MVFLAIIFVSLYSFVGQFHIGVPRKLPLTVIDTKTPLINETFWIYISDYIFLILAGLLMPDHPHFYRLRKAFLALIFFHFAFFVICPTEYHRPYISGEDISSKLGQFIHMIDAKTNCFPSLHVSSTFLAAFAVINRHKFLTLPALLWATAIAGSTLTTKQHYFYDVIGGLIISLVIFAYYYRKPILDK